MTKIIDSKLGTLIMRVVSIVLILVMTAEYILPAANISASGLTDNSALQGAFFRLGRGLVGGGGRRRC